MKNNGSHQCGIGAAKDSPGFPHDYLIGNLNHEYRAEKSFFGYSPSVLKSGIQKYARHEDIQKGLWCLVEMDLFSLLEWDGAALEAYLREHPKNTPSSVKAQGQKIRTNMANRLVVMMSEEVSISAWWMELESRHCRSDGVAIGDRRP